MIFDHISNKEKYRGLPWLYGALEAMAPVSSEKFEPGQVVIDGKTLFLNCNAYNNKLESDCFFESHKEYIDVHLMVSGEEIIGHNEESLLEVTRAYDAEGDATVYQGNIQTQFVLKAGWFAVFLPGEPHLVGLPCGDDSVPVKKIVAKVAGHLASL